MRFRTHVWTGQMYSLLLEGFLGVRSSPLPLLVVFQQKSEEVDAVFEHPLEADKYWVDDKHRSTGVLHSDKPWLEARPTDQHAEKLRFERTVGEPRTAERQTDRLWTESRHPDRHMDRQWTVDRHTQRQIDRKIERQWMGGRQIDRSWSEHRPPDAQQVDNQWTEGRQGSRKTETQVQTLHLAQRPLPPYPSDRTPSPKQETDPLKSAEAAVTAADWHQPDAQGDRQMCPDAGGGFTEGWRSSGGGGRAAPCASKPDPPPQSSKPSMSKLRQRHRLESSDALPGTSLWKGRLSFCKKKKRFWLPWRPQTYMRVTVIYF